MARRAGSDGAQTKRNLEAAALKLFATKGYAAVSMRMIAQEVGVQAGAIYNHVANKQLLLAALMTSHMEDVLAGWADAKASYSDDPQILLRGFVHFHLSFHLPRTDAVFISYMELRNLEPENFARIEALRSQYENELRAILTAGHEAGAFHAPEAAVSARAIIAMLTGTTGWFRQGGRLSASELEDIYIDMVMRSVRP